MAGESPSRRTAQLDKPDRERLEDVVEDLRERAEANVAYQLRQRGLETEPEDADAFDEDDRKIVEAIELERLEEHTWGEAYERYVTGVGYTVVNRLAGLRCMEVRGFLDEEVTVFMESGLTPAGDTVMMREFLEEDEAILEAYREECDRLADEIEILFDRTSAYSLVDPDADTYEDLCRLLDEVPDEVWRADDVLGWVYEYYNVELLDDLRRKGDREGLDPEDVPPANQFYTPHWVVRMLTDNSLGKLYLEHTGELQEVVERQETFSPDERKNRPLSPEGSPGIADLCTYLVPSEGEGEPTDFDHPEELRVIDPACGSGHFLLYAFDVLERIWRVETNVDHAEIPREVLRNNLHGVDLDMRACQLTAFNLYLKARTRTEAEGADGFDMPQVGIVCADASVADIDGVEAVFEEVAGSDENVERALQRVLDAFEEVRGIGSLLDVRGTLGDLFEDDADVGGMQLTLGDDPRRSHTLGQVLSSLRESVEDHRHGDSLVTRDLRSFVRLLDVLAQEYDVALMNPPYGAEGRMPDSVQEYVEERYTYSPEFYVNFVEVCNTLCASNGRIGMLIPRSFMFKRSFEDFRKDFQGEIGSFDFLAEFGLGILDNATVRTVGTVLRSGTRTREHGTFIRLADPDTGSKERVFTAEVLGDTSGGIRRRYRVELSEFGRLPKSPMSYWTTDEARALFEGSSFVDADVAQIEGDSVADVKTGLQTGNNPRLVRNHWEVSFEKPFYPFAKGGTDAWTLPRTVKTVWWGDDGAEIKRLPSSRPQNTDYYFREGLTWTYIKETGRRFGYYPAGGIFDQKGPMVFPHTCSAWAMQVVLNSTLYHGLFLSLTPDREWNPGDVGRIPYDPSSIESERVEAQAKAQYELFVSQRRGDPTSPYYAGPHVLPDERKRSFVYTNHPHTAHAPAGRTDIDGGSITAETPIPRAVETANERTSSREAAIRSVAERSDELVYDLFDVTEETRRAIETEIRLRGADQPDNLFAEDDRYGHCVALVHHFAMEAVREEPDGIVPLYATDDQPAMLDRIVERFEDAYGEHAEARLAEVDGTLGAASAADEAYPNLRAFLAEDLFDYHVDTMENAPIVWRFTTERLVADSTGEGFACFVDYHGVDTGLFDRLSNRYLEPRKAELRERRSTAARRRDDDSLSASERAEAVEAYEHSTSGLDQIGVFEDVIQELSSPDEREFDVDDRRRVAELAPKVTAFREETRKRVETLSRLRDRTGETWFQDTFSDTFWEHVDERREEWLDTLGELEAACEAYAEPADEPVEAHLADLFDYFNWRLKGSDHYASSGVLFMTYYFEREGADLLDDDGGPRDHLSADERLLASLATGLDDASVVDEAYLESATADVGVDGVADLPPLAEYKALAEEIGDRCETVASRVPSNWADRARSEVTAAGYRPNRKHGVAINLTPLAEAEIVPKTVDEKVI
ncbi:BREX-5 system adenine-specific DNA-methyltransferase PglX [Halorubrum sp. 48-1-W]|uniref:BREX-5 system adenine-specific DNA-methyltransferase PglX n=1 Tax=Halorubrum sp. 48-1-W TaxID=2249761 RepID=UPI000DCC2CE9|nr:BREX-5 system adenine-specific DNA-methyltransferase PglX [Halorubrum sp. 48-1-W]RAW45788.1 BREX-5 system adenine-specific DNA-methyltransferase PglX [Halorubrum sp. 48-1-W]